MRRRSPGTPLVKKDNVISGRIKKLPVHRDQAAARSAMKKNNRDSVRIADPFVIDRMNVRNRLACPNRRVRFQDRDVAIYVMIAELLCPKRTLSIIQEIVVPELKNEQRP